ncbi:LytTR family DNA-binding domain-containing protein [Aquimarina sp. 2201CG5-10]|uniref:LytR/AlgR family response regulator transcription factor n=1 Tax=Aquimarina callyspongiae TaxID=3098150 RepID=UPI002AB4693A|nr:LytTR family DNA-binding domain-containing protein [Aquimarina sp. 2201CG5-10]MDY8135516.1 LytTR family DNA-binding domain-containing protein [Aquimarina sp. 2201CG5-10]
MNLIRRVLKLKKTNRLYSRLQTGIALIIIVLVANHLSQSDHFPFNDSYDFPLFSILTSTVIGTLILIIADLNFKYFKEKHFVEKITPQNLIYFLLSTLGYISIIYVPIYYFVVWLKNEEYEFYYLLTGLSITLLLSSLGIIFLFAKEVYQLYKLETISGKINVKQRGKTFLLNYSEISYIYSENKIVYFVKSDGQVIATDSTLNEIENKISEHLFFRANRQTILHFSSIENLKPIENGKLLVTLTPGILEKNNYQINISRYKKKPFEQWLEHKL